MTYSDVTRDFREKRAELERTGYNLYGFKDGFEATLKEAKLLRKWGFSVKIIASPSSEGLYYIYTKKP